MTGSFHPLHVKRYSTFLIWSRTQLCLEASRDMLPMNFRQTENLTLEPEAVHGKRRLYESRGDGRIERPGRLGLESPRLLFSSRRMPTKPCMLQKHRRDTSCRISMLDGLRVALWTLPDVSTEQVNPTLISSYPKLQPSCLNLDA